MQIKKSTTINHIFNIIKFMKNKIPSFLLFSHIIVMNYTFKDCDPDELNKILFIIYYIISSIACFVWEFIYCYFHINQKKKILCKDISFIILTSLISLLSFLSTTFYLNINNVNNCFYNYNKIVASFIFFTSYIIIFIISTIENFKCKDDIKLIEDINTNMIDST